MSDAFNELVDLVAKLRGPEGCPWDRKQTHESLKPYLLEESYEVLAALDRKNPLQLREELGDLLLQILLHADIAQEQGYFTIQDVATTLSEKLIRRHPHVFENSQNSDQPLTPDQVVNQWEKIKQTERSNAGKEESILEGVPASLPALLRAYQVQKRVARVGFDWEKPEDVVEKLDEELQELRDATSPKGNHGSTGSSPKHSFEAIEEEFGDVLFTVANLARFLKINPEEALRKTCNRFVSRFAYMERRANSMGKALHHLTPTEWDTLWEAAKQQEQAITQ